VEERVARLEQALEEIRAENRQLRTELEELRAQVTLEEADASEAAAADTSARRSFWTRTLVIILSIFVVGVPVLLTTAGHIDAIWSAAIGFVNALVVYLIGPGAIRLLAEGLVRAIPGVLLGHTTRIAFDNIRNKKKAR
jgi:hypothetical protein